MELPMRKYDENYNKITQKVANIRSLVLFEPKNDQLSIGFGQSNPVWASFGARYGI